MSVNRKPKERPWYPRHVDAFNTDDKVIGMTWAERGFYDFLLDAQWKHGSIPADRARLARWAKMPLETFEATFGEMVDLCFAPIPSDPTRLQNSKMERVRAEQDAVSEAQRKRVNNRYQSGSAPVDERYESGSLNLKSETLPSEEKEKKETPSTAAPSFDFASVYAAYPRKEGKTKGIARLRSQVRTPEAFEQLQRAARNYAEKIRAEGTEMQFVQHFSTWANGNWRDYIDDPHIVTRQSSAPKSEDTRPRPKLYEKRYADDLGEP